VNHNRVPADHFDTFAGQNVGVTRVSERISLVTFDPLGIDPFVLPEP